MLRPMTVTPDGTVLIGRDPEPYEITVLILGFLYGIICTFRYDLAATSIRTYPGIGGRVFLVLLAFSSFVGLVGLASRSMTGIRLEGSALTLQACLGLAYSMWTPFVVGTRGLGLILFLGLILTIPSTFVALRLRRYLRKADEVARRLAEQAAEQKERPGDAGADTTQ